MKKDESGKGVSFRFKGPQHEVMHAYSEELGISHSEAIRRAVKSVIRRDSKVDRAIKKVFEKDKNNEQ
ncbi:hypothetical protein [uncultured Methylophaga sp.]|uniref:hypothetical protein n=1 Tax=uncultured Methylophaga sp. TaxID=285271 RepID=UPI00263872AB|nr:hypothetical protein [uncultured Methylophaga sp.]